MLHETLITSVDSQPMSRTFQYKKIMKPMLERKRRARINHCLDQLKELMVTALQAEGENISKLEKADILELTVQHLHKLRRQQRLASNPVIDSDRFRSGFTHCATEVSKCLATIPGVDIHLGTKLMTHLGHRLNDLDMLTPLSVRVPESSLSTSSSPAPSSPSSSYSLPPSPPVSTPSHSPTPSTQHLLKVYEKCPASPTESVWRPW